MEPSFLVNILMPAVPSGLLILIWIIDRGSMKVPIFGGRTVHYLHGSLLEQAST